MVKQLGCWWNSFLEEGEAARIYANAEGTISITDSLLLAKHVMSVKRSK